ncbi:MAG: HAMP domain-containing histidine kinase [Lachnospiraceae bacterium]|nr:HAMP domain-containing histidine kinase [Lachnospiraceae bacterium]
MEENKKQNKLSYSRSGKLFRGFLCMVTFFAFATAVLFSIYAVETYGSRIITDHEKEYRRTNSYAMKVQSGVLDVLINIHQAEQMDLKSATVTIIDAGKKKSYDLDLDKFSGGVAGFEQCVKDYRVRTSKLDGLNIEDYGSVRKYLKRFSLQDDFLYLDTDDFISLFETNGYRNTGYRFSREYSQKACFIFDYQGSYIQDEMMNDIGNLAAGETQYDLGGEQYAVYDPASGTFYSVWDDFFGLMDSYIYKVSDLINYISAEDTDGIRYNSMIIPMLKCYNYEISTFADEAVQEYNYAMSAKEYLDSCEYSGIHYLFTYDDKIYTNMDGDITAEQYCYKLVKNDDQDYELLNGDGTPVATRDLLCDWDLNSDETLNYFMGDYPKGTVLYYAIVPGMGEWDSVSRQIQYYPFYAYTNWFLVIAGIAVLLLVVQAVWLIRTTGRESREDSQVHLNRFDCFTTEIWFIVSIALLGFWPLLLGSYGILSSHFSGDPLSLMVAAAETVPFAFCFMIVTLSFARRIKAGNLWTGALLYKVIMRFRTAKGTKPKNTASKSVAAKCYRRVTGWITHYRDAYRKLSGTTRFTIKFAVYTVINMLIVIMIGVMSSYDGNLGVMMFLIYLPWQALAILSIRRIVRDTNNLVAGVGEITKGDLDYKITLDRRETLYLELVEGVNHIGDGLKAAVETSLKDERMKTELITNVSHDLKTPLTSIINYINLLKAEKMPTSEAEHYIEVLDAKAQRLKQLTEDLVEAAKATSGNIELEMVPLTFDELMKQALGEFEDKFAARNLTVIAHYPEKPAVVMADGRRMFRILENILQNAYKYALEGTRIYADLSNNRGEITFTLKNVSAAVLNISPDELMERFTRGDSSRTTEGSGLGLTIARDLTRLQNGNFEIILDGDLFKVIVTFPEFVKNPSEGHT